MFKKLLMLCSAALVGVALFLTLAIALVVTVGTALNYCLPAVPLEFACVIAGLVILIGLAFLSVVLRFFQLASSPPFQVEDDELEEEEPEEFADQIAEIVSQKLEPHFSRHRRSKSRHR